MLPYESSNEKRPELNNIIPENPNQPYDMKEVITRVADKDSFHEIHKDYAENIVVGVSRIGRRKHSHVGRLNFRLRRNDAFFISA